MLPAALRSCQKDVSVRQYFSCKQFARKRSDHSYRRRRYDNQLICIKFPCHTDTDPAPVIAAAIFPAIYSIFPKSPPANNPICWMIVPMISVANNPCAIPPKVIHKIRSKILFIFLFSSYLPRLFLFFLPGADNNRIISYSSQNYHTMLAFHRWQNGILFSLKREELCYVSFMGKKNLKTTGCFGIP